MIKAFKITKQYVKRRSGNIIRDEGEEGRKNKRDIISQLFMKILNEFVFIKPSRKR